MKEDRFLRQLLAVFVLSLVFYVAFYWVVEGRRKVQSPWRVSFQADSDGTAVLVVEQESLKLGPVEIRLPSASSNGTLAKTNVSFDTPKPFPYATPVGECTFADLTFLPGTVALKVHGTDIQMLPRTLTIGTNEIGWGGARSVEAVSNQVVRIAR